MLVLLHDNIDRLARNFAMVDDRMRRTFGEVLYCVYENDSTDGTAEWIGEGFAEPIERTRVTQIETG